MTPHASSSKNPAEKPKGSPSDNDGAQLVNQTDNNTNSKMEGVEADPPAPVMLQCRPGYYLRRSADIVTPMVAMDELPPRLDVAGLPRSLNIDDARAEQGFLDIVGPAPKSTYVYDIKLPPEILQAVRSQRNHADEWDDAASKRSDFFEHDLPGGRNKRGFKRKRASEDEARFGRKGGSNKAALSSSENEKLAPSMQEHIERAGVKYSNMLREQWQRQGKNVSQFATPTSAVGPGAMASSHDRDDRQQQQQVYNPITQGLWGRKLFCSHWMRTGECDFTQQGCQYLHIMPDLHTMSSLGMHVYPRWFREMPRQYQMNICADFDENGLVEPQERRSGKKQKANPKRKRTSGGSGGGGLRSDRPPDFPSSRRGKQDRVSGFGSGAGGSHQRRRPANSSSQLAGGTRAQRRAQQQQQQQQRRPHLFSSASSSVLSGCSTPRAASRVASFSARRPEPPLSPGSLIMHSALANVPVPLPGNRLMDLDPPRPSSSASHLPPSTGGSRRAPAANTPAPRSSGSAFGGFGGGGGFGGDYTTGPVSSTSHRASGSAPSVFSFTSPFAPNDQTYRQDFSPTLMDDQGSGTGMELRDLVYRTEHRPSFDDLLPAAYRDAQSAMNPARAERPAPVRWAANAGASTGMQGSPPPPPPNPFSSSSRRTATPSAGAVGGPPARDSPFLPPGLNPPAGPPAPPPPMSHPLPRKPTFGAFNNNSVSSGGSTAASAGGNASVDAIAANNTTSAGASIAAPSPTRCQDQHRSDAIDLTRQNAVKPLTDVGRGSGAGATEADKAPSRRPAALKPIGHEMKERARQRKLGADATAAAAAATDESNAKAAPAKAPPAKGQKEQQQNIQSRQRQPSPRQQQEQQPRADRHTTTMATRPLARGSELIDIDYEEDQLIWGDGTTDGEQKDGSSGREKEGRRRRS